MTPAEAGVVLDALVAAFPRTQLSAETVQIYARFLVDFDLEAAVNGAAKWIARGKGFPLISELREACAVAGGDGVPDADLAFREVLRAVSRWGAYGEPKWSHPAIEAAVESIGWREVCLSDNAPALRAHFAKSYEAAKKRTTDPKHAQLVAGVVKDLKQQLVGADRKALSAGKP